MKREAKLIKNTMILTVGTVISKIASIIALPIYVKWLTKTEYGNYDLIVTVVAMFLPIVTLQIQLAAFRFLLDSNGIKEQKSVISNCYFFIIASSLFFAFLIILFLPNFNLITRVLIATYLLLDSLVQLTRQICRGYTKNKTYVISSIIETFINLLLIIVFVILVGLGLNGMLLALVCSLFLSLIYLFKKLNLINIISIKCLDKNMLKTMIVYSAPLIFNSISWQIINASDRLIIIGFLDVEINAIYAAANKIPSIYHLLYSTFNLAWQESATISNKDNDVDEYYTSVFNQLYKFLFCGLMILIAATPFLVKILLNESYYSALYQMPILYIALFLSSFSSFYGGIYLAFKKTNQVGISSIISAVINIVVNLIFIKKFGLFAASCSTLIAFLTMTIYRLIDIRKFVKIKYNLKNILTSIILIPCFVVCCYINNNYLNILSTIIACIIFVIYNKNIIKIGYIKIKGKFNGRKV